MADICVRLPNIAALQHRFEIQQPTLQVLQNVFVCVLFDMQRLCLVRVQNISKMRIAVRIRRVAAGQLVACAVDVDDDFPAVRLRDVKFQNQYLALQPVVVRTLRDASRACACAAGLREGLIRDRTHFPCIHRALIRDWTQFPCLCCTLVSAQITAQAQADLCLGGC